MASKHTFSGGLIARTVVAWVVTLLIFFPLGWLILTAFKTEAQAIAVPPLFFFRPTLANFAEVQQRSDYLLYATNSLITSVASTLLGLAIAAPAAYSMAFFRSKRTRDLLMWMLSTKMMPAVGAFEASAFRMERSIPSSRLQRRLWTKIDGDVCEPWARSYCARGHKTATTVTVTTLGTEE